MINMDQKWFITRFCSLQSGILFNGTLVYFNVVIYILWKVALSLMLFALRGWKIAKLSKYVPLFGSEFDFRKLGFRKKKRLSGRKIKRLFPFAVYRWPATSPRKCLEKQAPSQNGMVLLRTDVANRGASSGFKGGNETWHPLKKRCKRNSRFTVHGQCLFLILVDIFLLFFWYCCRLLYWESWHIPDVFDNVPEKVDTPFQYKAHHTIPPTPGGGTSSIFLRNPALKI